MVVGHHVIFGAYGFWLPNDPRGSWSDFVGSWELFRLGGPATKTDARVSVAHQPHDFALRLAAKKALRRPPVQFTGIQARAVGRGFAEYAQRAGLTIWACAILPDHVHLVLGAHRLKAEQIVIQLKGAATRRLVTEEIHPFGDPSFSRDAQRSAVESDTRVRPPKCFARGEWKVFLNTPEDIIRAILYVENNPTKEGKPHQRWPFVVPFVAPFV